MTFRLTKNAESCVTRYCTEEEKKGNNLLMTNSAVSIHKLLKQNQLSAASLLCSLI